MNVVIVQIVTTTEGWLEIWRRVVWRPTLAVVGAIYAAVALGALIRDDGLPLFLSAQDAKTWQGRLAPQLHFDWYWWVIGILAALLVVVLEGVFRIVRQERRDAATEREKLIAQLAKLEAEKPKPDFIGTIDQTLAGDEPDDPLSTGVLVQLSILNKGAPSIAQHYKATVVVGGVKRQADLYYIPEDTELTMANGKPMRVNSSEAIHEKDTTLIGRGAKIHGLLRLKVNGVRRAEFARAGTSVEISFEDFLGQTYVARDVFTGAAHEFMYFAGGPKPGKLPRKGRK